ncbi:phage tail sheath family protein [Sorangium sp. So ce1000]|uniref:phage tail sheath family protein n=1 Tax=Sorangium sp. So ce1000 TaxID=3133325 RepID=UPI003F5FBFFF
MSEAREGDIMAYNIGLNVVEVDGAGAPAIVSAATSVAAFNITTRRGVPNQPVRVTSFQKFTERFGSYTNGGLGAYLVKGFFDNGGQVAYVNRVISNDATTGDAAAAMTLLDGASKDTLKLEGGYRGVKDPGAWGNALYVRVAASTVRTTRLRETAPAAVTSSTLAATIDLSTPPKLSVIIDGEDTATDIVLTVSDFSDPTKATLAQIRDAINRKTTKLVASLSGTDKIALTSTGAVAMVKRAFTSLKVSADATAIGFTAMPNAVNGTPAAVTTGGTKLADVSALKQGDAIKITDGTNTALTKLLTINATTGDVTWAPAASSIGTFAALSITVAPVTFDLIIAQDAGDKDHVVETWPGLSMEPDVSNYAPNVLNDILTGSRYFVATDAGSSSTVGADVPAPLAFSRVTPGRDGTPTVNEFIGDQAKHTGFYAFDAYDVQLVTCERTDPGILTAGLAYCAGRADCMYVGAVPQHSVGGGSALAYGQAFQGKKVYGALYGPWIAVVDPIGIGDNPIKMLPPVGHVMGVYARIETTRGIWKAPAGDEANLLGVLDVEYRLSDAEHTDLVKNGSINGVRAVARAGIIVDASRTLSTDTRWLYVNVRLLFNYVKSSLKQGLRWVRQEPNRDSLWNAVKFSSVNPFLMQLWRQGAFGTGTPAQTFTVICDASNNPPDQVDQGNLKIEVYFYPSKPAETIVIVVGQQPSGASASEA